MNIFLCFGAHDGSLVSKIDSVTKSGIYGNSIEWDKIHLFEPQNSYRQSLMDLCEKDKRCVYHKKAVSIAYESASLYIRGVDNMGSSLDQYKSSGVLHAIEVIEKIDIEDWIVKNTSNEDFLVIDMDIECEEFNILPKIINSEIQNRIKFISVEFHEDKSSYWKKDHIDTKIKNQTIDFFKNRFLDHNKYYA